MSRVGRVRLARRGSLITGGASSSELIFSMPPTGGPWLLGGRGGGSRGGRGGASFGGRGGGGVMGTRGGWVGGRVFSGCGLCLSAGLVRVECRSEDTPESILDGVCGVGETRERGDSAEDGVPPHRRWREEIGYSLVAEGAMKVSLERRPPLVVGVPIEENSVSDSLSS